MQDKNALTKGTPFLSSYAKTEPLVTIVITSYNYAAYVESAVRSALSQSYKKLEVLVLDNASTDNSLEVIRSIHDERLRVVARPENIGIQKNHNDGIRQATGDFVLFLSADDQLLPTLVEDLLEYRRVHPDIDIVYASAIIASQSGELINYFDHPSFDGAESYYGRNEFASLLTRDSCMYLPTILFPRAIFDELGMLDESLEIVLDYEYGIRMASAGKRFGFMARPGAIIRFHGENRSGVKSFVGSGKQLREFSTLLERYSKPKYRQALAGWRAELMKMIDTKIKEFADFFPAEFEAQRPQNDPFVHRARESVAEVPDASDESLSGHARISVIIPFNGRVGFLQRALRSLQAQTYDNWEAIVIVDRAADPSDLIRLMALEDRVRVSRLRSLQGVSAARNLGLGGVAGEIVAYLDDDNRFAPDYLSVVAEAFRDPLTHATIANSRVLITREDGAVFLTADLPTRADVSNVSNVVPLNAIAHRRSALAAIGRFHPGMTAMEDWEFLLRLNRVNRLKPIDATVEICVNALPGEHHLFGRRDNNGWNEVMSRIADIHRAYQPRSQSEEAARNVYMASLEKIVNRGMAGIGKPDEMLAFVLGVDGYDLGIVAVS
jgi:glycosyltransferase involved in cell wall biosynthesis